ncbi:MAG TPA: PilZ domain-containing protein [Syntrophales bacterium]|nr:PilZ domain-containing protein [Syntrophales bacterium]HON22862.1 PilZ domain-containing protein [Syntrophales bacterium]HOU77057.1 PilZ domain-containing protein [Syntrophales bacterium]HPC32930.1 PilZ domain-containing protein [Syntrophales bacterium]HQG35099.1 PilZ domain-containing protein [Syntrophales bacterium]
MEIPGETFTNRREYSRVYAYIPLGYRLVGPDEHHSLHARFSGDAAIADFKLLPEITDTPEAEWFQIINKKLDMIIRLLTVQGEGFQLLPYKAVNISGSGISFSTAEPFQVGDTVELKMILAGVQSAPLYLYAYGEVKKAERQTSGYVVSAKFIKMDDAIRDEIVRFVFEREREIIRGKKKDGGI